ncbi:hypothetical protein pdam_00008564 [Pocillopora damicornis]|uniref:Uncharacterized protein n=1 Tax=Pocillopora damicornis TaxID=46731 RepID=A0A3M6U2K9_POCDA|nr:hypothetical protein pdam_00008564 [Pocillopora damicornis]
MQNIAVRSQEESRNDIWEVSDINRGNFLELLHLRCKDLLWLQSKLQVQLQLYAQGTSPTIQNELLAIVSDLVLERITTEVRKSGYFGIMDETSDISRTEEMVLSLGGGEGRARASAEDNGSPSHFIKGSRSQDLQRKYLQGEQTDVITAKKTADAVVKTLSNCRNEESFTQMWSHADVIAQKIRIGIEGTKFTLGDAKVPRTRPSRRLQGLTGETPAAANESSQQTAKDHFRITV